VQRLQQGTVGKDKRDAHTKVEGDHDPTQPRKGDDSTQDSARLEFLAEAEAPPLCSRNRSSDEPKHPYDKEADKFAAKGRHEVILHAPVDGTNDEDSPADRHHSCDQEFNDIRIIEILSSVQRIAAGEMVGIIEPTDGKTENNEGKQGQSRIGCDAEGGEVKRHNG